MASAKTTSSSAIAGGSKNLQKPKKKKLTNAELKHMKQKQRRLNKKKKKKQQHQQPERREKQQPQVDDQVEVEYVASDESISELPQAFHDIFFRFKNSGDATVKGLRRELALSGVDPNAAAANEEEHEKKEEVGEDKKKEEKEEEEEEENLPQSKKQRKLQNRVSISSLKQVCRNPEAVEVWDITAQDPELLVSLKSYRNTVPVPMHWSQKRKFLQGKRGIEKPPFKLPEFISATGIENMRGAAAQEKEDEKKLKTKTRERLNPKMGKIEIDYQVLHDAFFKYQKKPKLSRFGDLYYEGKEFEVELKQKRPGRLSKEAEIALGMIEAPTPPPSTQKEEEEEEEGLGNAMNQDQDGNGNDDKTGGIGGRAKGKGAAVLPSPWLVNMQRYGPPPSYPSLLIPGLNAPIPEGASFGYHPGGWGKPPVDELGHPLYGDVFGIQSKGRRRDNNNSSNLEFEWGGMEEEEESESEYEEVDPEDLEDMEDDSDMEMNKDDEDADAGGLDTPAAGEGEAPINLRKNLNVSETPELYKVLPEVGTSVKANQFMGSDKVYDVSGSGAGQQAPAGDKNDKAEAAASAKAATKPEKEKKKEKAFKF